MWHLTLLNWRWLLYHQCTHTKLCAHTHLCWQSEIPYVCVCVVTTHLFYIEALLQQRMFVMFVPAIYQQDCLKKILSSGEGCLGALWFVSHEADLVLVSHHRKPLCGFNQLFGGGLELGNPTLHSLARNLISHKGNVAHLSKNVLKICFLKSNCCT